MTIRQRKEKRMPNCLCRFKELPQLLQCNAALRFGSHSQCQLLPTCATIHAPQNHQTPELFLSGEIPSHARMYTNSQC